MKTNGPNHFKICMNIKLLSVIITYLFQCSLIVMQVKVERIICYFYLYNFIVMQQLCPLKIKIRVLEKKCTIFTNAYRKKICPGEMKQKLIELTFNCSKILFCSKCNWHLYGLKRSAFPNHSLAFVFPQAVSSQKRTYIKLCLQIPNRHQSLTLRAQWSQLST